MGVHVWHVCVKYSELKRVFHYFTVFEFPLKVNFAPWCPQRDDMEAIPGYLSLHQTADLMTLKWTPNQLMNGNVGELDSEKRSDSDLFVIAQEYNRIQCTHVLDSLKRKVA